MNTHTYKAIAFLQIIGGFFAFYAVLGLAMSQGATVFLMLLPIVFMYCYGIWSGVLIFRSIQVRALVHSRVFWILQIPMLTSPIASFFLYSGISIPVSFLVHESAININIFFGGQFMISILDPSIPLQIGVNLFALFVAIYIGSGIGKLRKAVQ